MSYLDTQGEPWFGEWKVQVGRYDADWQGGKLLVTFLGAPGWCWHVYGPDDRLVIYGYCDGDGAHDAAMHRAREAALACWRLDAAGCKPWCDGWCSVRGKSVSAADSYAALEARAALAEARLEALWTMDRERWNAGLYLQEFNTVEDLADALRARALGCNVEELPERSGRAAVPEVAP